MQYIPLNNFFGFLEKPVNVYSSEELNQLASEISTNYQQEKFISVAGNIVSSVDAIAFCTKLNHPGMVVFDQWICQHKNLFNGLINRKLTRNDFDVKQFQDHFLFSDFQRFISPFLAQIIQEIWSQSTLMDKQASASYISLLDSSYRLEIQHLVRNWIEDFTTNQLELARVCQTEKDLAHQLQSLFSIEMLEILNALYPSHYEVKIFFVQETIQVIHWSSCTPRLGIWLTNQLKKIQLHQSHLDSILAIQQEIEASNFSKGGTKRSKKTDFIRIQLLYLVLLVSCFAGLIYWIFSDPLEATNTSRVASESQSSLAYFTPKERKEIDSLLRTIEPKSSALPKSSNDQAVLLPPSNFETVFRKPFTNPTAEQFYADCMKDQHLLERGLIKNCNPLPAKKIKSCINQGFQQLTKHVGTTGVFLQNESKYQLLILVFNDASTKVSAQILNPSEKLTFQMNPLEIFMCIPGNDWAKFEVGNVAASEKPSTHYNYHFCVQDANLMAMLNAPFRLKNAPPKKVKWMVESDSKSDQELVILDMDEVLERFNSDENASN